MKQQITAFFCLTLCGHTFYKFGSRSTKNLPARVPSGSTNKRYSFTKLAQEVVDESDGCGAKFMVIIVSSVFEGKSLLQRHRLVNSVLEKELKTIHAFSQKTLTPEEWKK